MTQPVTFEVQIASNAAQLEVQSTQVAVSPDVYPKVVVTATPGGQGPPGQPGGGVQRVTAQALSGHRLVAPLNNGTIDYADCTTAAHMNRPVWLTTGAWAAGVTATVVAAGPVTEPTWNWTPGQPIWLGLNGALTQTIPPTALFVRRVAKVIDATTIEFNVSDAIAVI